ncbi:MAG: alpha/beta hydrolase [Anaerolineae bacterium]
MRPNETHLTLTMDGLPIHVWRAGAVGAQPLLLAHGFTDAAIVWQTLVDHLSADYDVIAYDGRGHGQSARVTERYTLMDLTRECLGVIDALGLTQPVIIGHSMGAAIAALAAWQAPHKLRAVVLEDPPITETVALTHEDMQNWKAQILTQQSAPPEFVREVYRTQLYPTWSEADIETRIAARQMLDVAVFDLMDWADTPRWQDWHSQVECKALLLTGDPALGGIVRPETTARLMAGWRGLQHVHVPTAGHHIRCSDFAAYWQALEPFLKDVCS